jgi:prepilin-type N-terminal cleavage/methylation domain-containing protein
MKKERNNNQFGFSLFEVLAVLTLMGMILVVITTSFIQSSATQRQLTGRLTALVLGESKLAELLNGAEAASSGKFTDPYAKYSWESQTESGESGTSVVAVTVKWSGRDGKLRQKIIKGACVTQ